MKIYNFNNNENYILNYKKQYGYIMINQASGKEQLIPYNEENEKNLLNQMEEQVKNANSEKLKDNMILDIIKTTSTSLGIILMTISAISFIKLSLILSILSITTSIYLLTLTKKNISNLKESYSTYQDWLKNITFLNNKEKINKFKNKENVINKCNEKTKELIIKEPTININNIEILSKDELYKLKEYVLEELSAPKQNINNYQKTIKR